jgi:nucleotide-binding universal stress UspA family protein
VPVQYAVVVGDRAAAMSMLQAKIQELGEGVLVVLGTHGRTGIRKVLWGSQAEDVLRDAVCPVLVVKAPVRVGEALASAVPTTASV